MRKRNDMLKRMISMMLVGIMIFAVMSSGLTTQSEAANSIKSQAEAVAWLNSQNNAKYDFDGAYGTQCVEFVKAYVNWLLTGNAWTDCWNRATGNGNTIWKNSLWSELGWTVYYNTSDFVPQPGDIFSAGVSNGNHTGVVISSDVNTAVIADANARNSDWSDGDPVYIHTITWKSASSDTAYGATHFIRPNFRTHTHSYTSSITKQPSCTAAGVRTYVCSCGNKYTETIPAIGHKWNSGEVISSAGCESEGVRKYTCTSCNATYNSAISATGHTPVRDAAVEATCLTTGLSEGTHCSVCQATIKAQEVTPALGHDYQLAEAETTCTTVKAIYKCTRCNHIREEKENDNVVSNWTENKPSGVADNLIEEKTQYKYRSKKTSESSSPNKQGWTQYDKKISGYGAWSAWTTTPISANEFKEVKTQNIAATYKTVWKYSRSVSGDGKLSTYSTSYYPNKQTITLDYQLAVKGYVDGYAHYGSYDGGYGTYLQNYWWNESSEQVVKTAARKEYASRDILYTYYFYQWSDWSDWQDDEVTATDNTNVETRTLYRYKIVPDGHTFSDDWSYDTVSHWHECNECHLKSEVGNHVYDNEKDSSCNICGAVREIRKPVLPTDPQVVVESRKALNGKEFTVSVRVANNPGFAYLEVTPLYSSELILVGVENGELINSFTQGIQYVWAADSDVSDNGLLLTFTFKTEEDVAPGKYSVDFILRDCIDISEQDVDIAVSGGIIEIVDSVYGDATGDKTIDMKDVVLLRKYMAEFDYDSNTSAVAVEIGGDVNGDGNFDMKDVVFLRKYIADFDYDTGTSSVVLGPQ